MKVQVISCGPVANDSERKAIERLKTSLISELGDGEWLLLTNLARLPQLAAKTRVTC